MLLDVPRQEITPKNIVFQKKCSFINLIEQYYIKYLKCYHKRYDTELTDQYFEEFLDYIFDDILIKPYYGGGRTQYDFTELLNDILDDYAEGKEINYQESTPSGKTFTITSLEDCFEYMFFLGLEGNLFQAIIDYLKYASGPYNAMLFFDTELTFYVNDFYTDEQIEDMCNWLTTEVLHNHFNLPSCKVFWDNEKFLLLDDNFVDEYTKDKLYQYLLEYGKTLGYSSLEEFDWGLE